MTDIDFYVDALLSESVLGLGPGVTADEVEGVLGVDYVDDPRKGWMRRDYGLIECHFNRVGNGWVCFALSIQIHRISNFGPEVIPRILWDRYGPFGDVVTLERVADAVNKKGAEALAHEATNGGFKLFRVGGKNAVAYARQSSENAGKSLELWSIHISYTAAVDRGCGDVAAGRRGGRG